MIILNFGKIIFIIVWGVDFKRIIKKWEMS